MSPEPSNPTAAGGLERLRFLTETGSFYELCRSETGDMTWVRGSATPASGLLRTEGGRLLAWPQVVVGARCELLSEPLNPPYPRLVRTSFVVALLDAVAHVIPARSADARRTFAWVRVGDSVTRVGAGLKLGDCVVTEVDADVIRCGSRTFDRVTGLEIDHELGWGPGRRVGTWLLHPADVDDE